jgi:hypothetical protein
MSSRVEHIRSPMRRNSGETLPASQASNVAQLVAWRAEKSQYGAILRGCTLLSSAFNSERCHQRACNWPICPIASLS